MLKGNDGVLLIDVFCDWDGSFEFELIKKGQIWIDGMDDKIIGFYVVGLLICDICVYFEEVYGLKVLVDFISCVIDVVLEEVLDWQNCVLELMYLIVFFDVLCVKICDVESCQVKNKVVYVVLGVILEGECEVLGFWIVVNEGVKFWFLVMNNLCNWGVEDILIVVVDGFKGFFDVINVVFFDMIV